MPIRLNPNDPRLPPEFRQAPRTRQRKPKADPHAFIALCVSAGLPPPIPEFRFASPRRWRFDWAFIVPHLWTGKIALEIQGAIFTQGRHVRGAELLKEYKKLNAAACLGWRVLFITPDQFERGDAIGLVRRALGME